MKPHRLAFAFAVGIFLGVLPGTGAILAAVLAAVFRLNLPLMISGAMLMNPLTAPFVYGGSYFLGRWMLTDQAPTGFLGQILLPVLMGSLILAVFLGGAGYLLLRGLFLWREAVRSTRLRREG